MSGTFDPFNPGAGTAAQAALNAAANAPSSSSYVQSSSGSFLGDLKSWLGGGSNSALSLGDFTFQAWEIPESITWGGGHHLAVHKLPGGERVIDAMGRDDDEITWSGIFLSADASDRADQVDQMRVDGQELELVFAGRNYSVVISHFKADQRKINHVPYTISCTVLSDESGALNDDSPSLLSSITSDINDALGFDLSGTLSDVQGAIQQVQGPLLTVTGLVAGGPAAAGLAGILGKAQGAMSGVQQLTDGNINGLATLAGAAGNISGYTTVAGAISGVRAAATLTQQAANLTGAASFVGRAVRNVLG